MFARIMEAGVKSKMLSVKSKISAWSLAKAHSFITTVIINIHCALNFSILSVHLAQRPIQVMPHQLIWNLPQSLPGTFHSLGVVSTAQPGLHNSISWSVDQPSVFAKFIAMPR